MSDQQMQYTLRPDMHDVVVEYVTEHRRIVVGIIRLDTAAGDIFSPRMSYSMTSGEMRAIADWMDGKK